MARTKDVANKNTNTTAIYPAGNITNTLPQSAEKTEEVELYKALTKEVELYMALTKEVELYEALTKEDKLYKARAVHATCHGGAEQELQECARGDLDPGAPKGGQD